VRDFSDDLGALRKRLTEAEGYLDLAGSLATRAELEQEMGKPDFWDDRERATSMSSAYGRADADVKLLEELAARMSDAETLFELAQEESDESVASELEDSVAALTKSLDALEVRSLFSGEHDEGDAVCEIHSGAGGTDAADWAEMMLRMYSRWAENKGFALEVDEVTEGGEAGIQSATFIIKGRYAYGLMRSEQGVHRLVRMSPFDAASRRQTSFASLDVTPFTDDASGEVDIDEKDLRIDTYRSSGAGGQHVNVTDSAVRITHLPTGVVVSCQNERSQTQNKARAMQVLVAKLIERQREDRRAELEGISGTAGPAAMGNQIRSYVQHPYQLVKDLRTEHATGNVQAVLEGDLDPFMEAFLRWERGSAGD
jgi:peptide chain release factor 2